MLRGGFREASDATVIPLGELTPDVFAIIIEVHTSPLSFLVCVCVCYLSLVVYLHRPRTAFALHGQCIAARRLACG